MAEKDYLTVRKVQRISKKTGNSYQALVVTLEDGTEDKYEMMFPLSFEQKRILKNVNACVE